MFVDFIYFDIFYYSADALYYGVVTVELEPEPEPEPELEVVEVVVVVVVVMKVASSNGVLVS